MNDKPSNLLHLYFEPDDKMGQRFVREAKALEQENKGLRQRVETAETIIARRDAKIKRQAKWITRLETSRASLREALAKKEV